jgi:ribosomal protein S8
MQSTVHLGTRMNQRGISLAMVNLVLEYGEIQQDKAVLGRKAAEQLLARMQREMKELKKIVDKGGVVVVSANDAIITTYNYKQRAFKK